MYLSCTLLFAYGILSLASFTLVHSKKETYKLPYPLRMFWIGNWPRSNFYDMDLYNSIRNDGPGSKFMDIVFTDYTYGGSEKPGPGVYTAKDYLPQQGRGGGEMIHGCFDAQIDQWTQLAEQYPEEDIILYAFWTALSPNFPEDARVTFTCHLARDPGLKCDQKKPKTCDTDKNLFFLPDGNKNEAVFQRGLKHYHWMAQKI